MANPLFRDFGNRNNRGMDMQRLVRDAQHLKRSIQGSPRDVVQNLLNSGAMTQEQFNQYSQMAQQILQNFGGSF